MGYCKTFLLLGLVFAVVLLVSSEVSARELAQTQENSKTDAVEETNKHHDHRHVNGHGHGHGHGHRHGHGHGHHGRHGAAGEKEAETETNQN